MEQLNEKSIRNNKDSLKKLQDNMKYNIHIVVMPVEEKKEQGIENLFEKVMTKTAPNLVRGKVKQGQEAQRVPIKINPEAQSKKHKN